MAAIGQAFRGIVGPAARAVKGGAAATETWATKAPTLSQDWAALTKATEGGLVVGDLPHLALRGAELYGWFCIGEIIGRVRWLSLQRSPLPRVARRWPHPPQHFYFLSIYACNAFLLTPSPPPPPPCLRIRFECRSGGARPIVHTDGPLFVCGCRAICTAISCEDGAR
jgi:hypothetical protein